MPTSQSIEYEEPQRLRSASSPCENAELLAPGSATAPPALRPPPYVRGIPIWARALPPRGRRT